MKILRIFEKKGEYVTKDSQWKSVISINKEDILFLLEKIYDNEGEIEIDEQTEESFVVNQAEKLIYENLQKQFNEFKNSLDGLKTDIEGQFQTLVDDIVNGGDK